MLEPTIVYQGRPETTRAPVRRAGACASRNLDCFAGKRPRCTTEEAGSSERRMSHSRSGESLSSMTARRSERCCRARSRTPASRHTPAPNGRSCRRSWRTSARSRAARRGDAQHRGRAHWLRPQADESRLRVILLVGSRAGEARCPMRADGRRRLHSQEPRSRAAGARHRSIPARRLSGCSHADPCVRAHRTSSGRSCVSTRLSTISRPDRCHCDGASRESRNRRGRRPCAGSRGLRGPPTSVNPDGASEIVPLVASAEQSCGRVGSPADARRAARERSRRTARRAPRTPAAVRHRARARGARLPHGLGERGSRLDPSRATAR